MHTGIHLLSRLLAQTLFWPFYLPASISPELIAWSPAHEMKHLKQASKQLSHLEHAGLVLPSAQHSPPPLTTCSD